MNIFLICFDLPPITIKSTILELLVVENPYEVQTLSQSGRIKQCSGTCTQAQVHAETPVCVNVKLSRYRCKKLPVVYKQIK